MSTKNYAQGQSAPQHKFEKNGKKGTCPHCGQRGKWRFFEGYHGNTSYGRCDRQNNCPSAGETHFPPTEQSQDRKLLKDAEPQPLYLEEIEVARLLENTSSAFHRFCEAHDIPHSHLRECGVGTDEDGNTVFLFRNKKGRWCNQKSGLYDPDTGKRIKTKEAPPFLSLKCWECRECGHRETHRRYKCSKCEAANSFQVCKSHRWTLPLFGEHLLTSEARKEHVIMVVESEKTQVIASWFYPDYIWVSCAANSGLSDGTNGTNNKIIPLYNAHQVVWLCDADKAGRKFSNVRNLQKYEIPHLRIDLFPTRNDGWDIADELLEGRKPNLAEELERSQQRDSDGLLGMVFSSREERDQAEKDWKEWRFFAMDNQYWSLNKKEEYEPFSNFTLEVLYHIEHVSQPKRIIRLVNKYGREVVFEAETKNLTSLGTFKQETEGRGAFVFWGDNIQFTKLKRKLFEMEKRCQESQTMGWNPDGFYNWVNGFYFPEKQLFLPASEYGFVEFEKEEEGKVVSITHYIKAANKTFENDPYAFITEKKFIHLEREVKQEDFARQFYTVHRDAGAMALMFAYSCLFSSIIYPVMDGFPIMFLYGEGGSGKGTMMKQLQHLWGKPQDPTPLSSNASTVKGVIRGLAQFVDTLIPFEEFSPGVHDDIIQLIKNIWDRFGYKRANKSQGFDTNVVPINSGVMITGNYYPSQEDMMLQRLIVLEMNNNTFSDQEREAFQKLKDMIEGGITSVTNSLLNLRPMIEQDFRKVFRPEEKYWSDQLKHLDITERMAKNLAVLSSMHRLISHKMHLPFTYEKFCEIAKQYMTIQSEKRSVGGDVQKFWDCILFALKNQRIKHGREFQISGPEIQIRFSHLHGEYMQVHRQLEGTPGLGKSSLLDKLKKSRAYQKAKEDRFPLKEDPKKPTSCHVFDYEEVGVDFFTIIEQQEAEERRRYGTPVSDVENGTRELTSEFLPGNGRRKDDLPF